MRPAAEAQVFQSTLPTRGSDAEAEFRCHVCGRISIHAPHEGERLYTQADGWFCPNFNPRSPRGGATARKMVKRCGRRDFNPRSPRGGATSVVTLLQLGHAHFNPRSPRGGATGCWSFPLADLCHFNPRSPRGGATLHGCQCQSRRRRFQSTLPTRGSDVNGFFDFLFRQ